MKLLIFWIHQESPVCEVIISSPFVAKIKYNGGVLFVCIFVKLMEWCDIGSIWTSRGYFFAVCLSLNLIHVFDAVQCHHLTVICWKKYKNGGIWAAFIFVQLIQRCYDVGPGRTERKLILLYEALRKFIIVSDAAWGHVFYPHFLSKYAAMAILTSTCACLCWIDGTMRALALDKQAVCLHCCVLTLNVDRVRCSVRP